MSHKGYRARIEYDDADGILVGHIAGISDIVGFHADSVAGLRTAFEEAVDDYLDTCRQAGKEPQKAFSGNLMLRISPDLHANVALAAQLAGVSINQMVEAALKTIGDRDVIGDPASPAGGRAAGKPDHRKLDRRKPDRRKASVAA